MKIQNTIMRHNSNLGFSLIEVLVATALLSILGLGLMSMTTEMFKNSKHGQNIMDAGNLIQTLNALLLDPAACKRNFGTAPGPGGILFNGATRTTDLVNNGGTTVFDVASTIAYENGQFYIADYAFENSPTILNPTSPAHVHGKLTFTFTKVNPTTSGNFSSFKRSVTIDANLVGAVGTGIDSCQAIGIASSPSAASYWSLAADTVSIINSNPGNVGIGTGTPAEKLDVVGSVKSEGNIGAATAGLAGFTQLWGDNSLNWKRGNANGGLRFGAANDLAAGGYAQHMILLDNGNLGVGVATPAEKFEVNGKITAYDDIQVAPTKGFVYLSDQRLKHHKTKLNTDAVSKIQTYTFQWIQNGAHDAGFIAQEVQKAFPLAVRAGADGYLRVDYPKLIVPLWETVRKQQMQIEKMQKQIDQIGQKTN